MMRRYRHLLFFLITVAALLAGGIWWLVSTEEGARFAFAFLSRSAGITLRADEISGSLARGLDLGGLRISGEHFRSSVGRARLRLRPLAILGGKLTIDELVLRRVNIEDSRPEKKEPLDLSWPTPPSSLRWLALSVDLLEIRELSYRRQDRTRLEAADISGRLLWSWGALTIEDLVIRSDSIKIKGELRAGLRVPSLKADISAEMPEGYGGIEKVSLRTDLKKAARSGEQVAGDFSVLALYDGETAEMGGRIGVTRSSLVIKGARLAASRLKGEATASGEVTFPEGSPFFRMRAKLARLNLEEELKRPTAIGGELVFEGELGSYRGSFGLSNSGKVLESCSLAGSFAGGPDSLEIAVAKGSWLSGSITAALKIGWSGNLSMKGEIRGSGIDPSRIDPRWRGAINLVAAGDLTRPGAKPIEGYITVRLLQSSFRGRELQGEVKTVLSDGVFTLSPLDLHGRGFDIHAEGAVNSRIDFAASVGDLGSLLPGAQGRLGSEGWIAYRKKKLSFSVSGSGGSIAYSGLGIEGLRYQAYLLESTRRPMKVNCDISGLSYREIRISAARLEAEGGLRDHSLYAEVREPAAELVMSLSGSYSETGWSGRVIRLSGRDRVGRWNARPAAALHLSERSFALSPLVLMGGGGERAEISADLTFAPLSGTLHAKWSELDLGRANQWVRDFQTEGKASGEISIGWSGGTKKTVQGNIEAFGILRSGGQSLEIRNLSSNLNWTERGASGSFRLLLGEHGKIVGDLSSPEAPGGAPSRGRIRADISELNPAVLRPWLPGGLILEGPITGRVNGDLLPDGRIVLNSSISLPEGKIAWRREKRNFSSAIRNAAVSLVWQGPSLSGSLRASLEEYGALRAVFSVPLPARFPVTMEPRGAVDIAVQGKMKVDGLLSSALPGLIEESRGDADMDISVKGQWVRPVMTGVFRLSGAAAYLPATGVHLRNVDLSARLEGDRVAVDSIRAESGRGGLEGSATIILKNWDPVRFTGSIKGKNFEFLYLPEIRASANPDLTFEGTMKNVAVRGEIGIADMTVTGLQERTPVTTSRDVVVVDARREREELPFALDLAVRVSLGESVRIKAEGADIQLSGSVELTAKELNDIRGNGTVKIVKGKYNAYGVDLDITKGVITFNGPADRPRLDIQAERKSGEVITGVFVTGTLQRPNVKLYSKPAMSEADTMAYLVLGRPVQGGSEEIGLVSRAAGALLSKSDSASIQDQLKRRLRLDTLDIESVQEGAFGQKEFLSQEGVGRQGAFQQPSSQETPAGQGTVQRSMVTVGKYLTPGLYVSFGRSLFKNANLLRLRYKFSKHWEAETQSGVVSGGDIFYQINFK